MNDEQTIYISPEDDLTTLRERLEQIPSRKITLVIPNQTQLRSHVAWKLLYARARELGKEVLIVSSDPQIRSVAHAVKFKVAHSLETHASPQRPRARTGNHSGSNTGRSNTAIHRSRPNTSPDVTPIQEVTTRGARTRQEDLHSSKLSRPLTYDFRIEATPPIQPLSIHSVEDPDLLLEDYTQAQNILQAASQPALPEEDREEPSIQPHKRLSPSPSSPQRTPQQFGDDDLFLSLQDDSQLPSLPEQKAEVTLEEFDNVQEYPQLSRVAASDLETNLDRNLTEQFHDDDESISPISSTPPKQGQRWDDRLTLSEKNETKQAPRSQELRPSANYTEMQIPSQSTYDEDEDHLPPVSEQAQLLHISQPLSLSQRRAESKPLTTQVKPQSSPLPAQKSQSKIPTRNKGGSLPIPASSPRPRSVPISQHHISTRPKGRSQRRQATTKASRGPRRGNLLITCIAALLIILLAVVSVVYLNISSTVKISVATQNYTHPLTLTLSSKNQSHTVPARPISQTFTKTMPEPATGSTAQDTNFATGSVYFINKSNVQIQIPSQLTLKTASNIEFVTTANAIILPQANTTVPIPVSIQAKQPGTASNVPAESITVIPQESLATIAQDQNTPIAVNDLKQNLTVTNPTPTTGGGASQVAAVTQADLDTAKKNLHQSAQDDITRWLQQYQKNGGVGQPTSIDTLINPPSIGTAEPDKTFSATLKITATVLITDKADIQKEALRALNAAIQADQNFGPKFAILGDFQTIKITQKEPSGNNANTIDIEATGQAGPNLDLAALQHKISGKPLAQAKAILQQEEPKEIKTIDIQTQPNIFGSVSPWANHITINVEPVATSS